MDTFSNYFEKKIKKIFSHLKFFNLTPLVMFVSANMLVFKIFTLVMALFMISFQFHGLNTLAKFEDHYIAIFFVWLATYFFSCILISKADKYVCNNDLANYGYGNKRWFILELRDGKGNTNVELSSKIT
jgi:hypothetical protein